MYNSTIKNKQKPCKFNDKDIDFQGCGKMCYPKAGSKGLCDRCRGRFLMDTPEGRALLEKKVAPLVEKRESFVAAKRDFEERKTLPALLSNAQIACNAFIRQRDFGLNCISCNTPYKSDFDAGHFYSAAKFPRLRFDEKAIAGQCIQCNRMKEGNHEMYRMGYEARYGSEQLAEIDEKARLDKLQGAHKWERSDLIRIRKYFTAKKALLSINQ